MKKSVVLAYLALLMGFFLPRLWLDGRPAAPSLPAELPPSVQQSSDTVVPDIVRLLVGEELREIPIRSYLIGVLAGEMPASFEFEALKAQAVAARTYMLYCATGGKHPNADVCAEPGHCQAWLDEPAMREAWGAAYEENSARLRAAVDATAGQCLCYEGQPVFAAFHSSSAGATEDCGQVWNPQPYLISVSSPESAESVPRYITELRCAPLDFRDTLLSQAPEADFTGDPEQWIGPLERDGSGRVAALTLGGVSFRGTQLRSLFSLRSTAFTLEFRGGQFCFTVTGSGHGVGMSQYGANVMAQNGADYRAILAHYYPGTTLVG